MRKIIILLLLTNVSIVSFADENIIFYHRALGIELSYPNEWILYSATNRYNDLDFLELSSNEREEMFRLSRMLPVLFIRKYSEIYYGINPFIKINAYEIFCYSFYLEYQKNIEKLEYQDNMDIWGQVAFYETLFDMYVQANLGFLRRGNNDAIIFNEIININGVEILFHKIYDYALDENNKFDERFERTSEYYLIERYGYIVLIETQYGTNNINHEIEVRNIINTLLIKN